MRIDCEQRGRRRPARRATRLCGWVATRMKYSTACCNLRWARPCHRLSRVLLCHSKVPFHSHVPVSCTDHEGSLFTQPPRTAYCNSRLSCAEGDQNTADNIPVSTTESHMAGMDTGMQEGPWHEEVPAMAASMNTYVSEEPAAPVAVHPPAGVLPCHVRAHP